MESIFLHLVNMSITAGWLVLAVVLFRLVFHRAPKWIHCLLWGLVAIRLVCPFSFESVLSLIPSAETVPVEEFLYDTPAIHSGVPVVDNVVNPVISNSFAPQPMNSVNPMQVLSTLAASIWVLGMVMMVLYMAITTLRLWWRVRESVRLQRNIFQCDRIVTPFILGIVRPRIYLPTTLSEGDILSVVAHEEAHIQRRDHWWKPLGFLLLTVYWFNLLLWLGYVLLCRDIEAACDEKVIKDMDVAQRKSYSSTLLACSAPRHLITACPLAFGETGVKSRIKAVLNYKKPAFWLIIVAVIASVVAAVCLLTDPKPTMTEELDAYLTHVILEHNYSEEHTGDAYPTEAHTVFGVEKKAGKTVVYGMVLYEEYYLDENGALQVQSGSHIPTVITVDVEGNGYSLVEYWIPRDGTYYATDIREKYPIWYWWQTDTQRHVDKHQQKTLADAKKHFGLDGGKDSSTSDNIALGSRAFGVPLWNDFSAVFGDVSYSKDNLPVRAIHSLEEFQEFISDYNAAVEVPTSSADTMLDLYKSPVFDRNIVVAVYYKDASSSVQPDVVGMHSAAGSGEATLFVDVYSPYMQNDAVGSWIMLTTINREYAENITAYSAQVRGRIALDYYAAAFKQPVQEPVNAQEAWRDRLNDDEMTYLRTMVSRLSWGERSMKADSGTYIGAFNNEGITYYVSSDYSFVCTEDEMAYLPTEDSAFLREMYQPRSGVTYITPYWREDVTAGVSTQKTPETNYWQTLGHPMSYEEASKVSGGRSLEKHNIKMLKQFLGELEWHSDVPSTAEQLFDAYFSLDGDTRYYVSVETWGDSGYLYDGKQYATLPEEQLGSWDFLLADGGSTIKATHYFYGYFAEWHKSERCYVLDVVKADDAALVGKKIRVNIQSLYGSGLPYIGRLLEVRYDGTVLGDTVYAMGCSGADENILNLDTSTITQNGTITGKVIFATDKAVLLNCYDKERFDVVWVHFGTNCPELTPQLNEEYTVGFDGQVMETYPVQVIAQTMTRVSSTPLNNGYISEERAVEIAVERWKVRLNEPDKESGYYTTVYVMEMPTAENPRYKLGSRRVDVQDGEPQNSALFFTMEIDAVTGEVLADSYMP